MGNVSISDTPAAALAEAFASVVGQLAVCNIAVSGGSTPRELFGILASDYRTRVAWERIRVFQVDERCVPPTDRQSNWKMLHEELLSKLPAITAYRMEAEHHRAAEDYEVQIRSTVPRSAEGIPRFDLILLGMGPDGHTASLFPGTHALEEQSRLVVLNEVPQLNTHRVTMTYPLINAADRRWFLARGSDKAEAYLQAQSKLVPAGLVREPHWFVDESVLP